MTDPDTKRYVLTIRSEPGYRFDFIARLRKFLKVALRAYGIRCIDIRPLPEEPP